MTNNEMPEFPPCTSWCQNSDNSNGICRGCLEREKTAHGILLNIAKRMTADSCIDYPQWLFTLIEEAIKYHSADLTQPDAELFSRMLSSLKKMQEYVSGTCDYLLVRDELNKAKDVIREADAHRDGFEVEYLKWAGDCLKYQDDIKAGNTTLRAHMAGEKVEQHGPVHTKQARNANSLLLSFIGWEEVRERIHKENNQPYYNKTLDDARAYIDTITKKQPLPPQPTTRYERFTMGNRYEYRPLILERDKDVIHHFVVDNEPEGFWNAWQFDTEDEAIKFIENKNTVIENIDKEIAG